MSLTTTTVQSAKAAKRRIVAAESALAAPRSSSTDYRRARPGEPLWRHEFKYLIPRHVRTALTADLRAFVNPDTHAAGDGTYLVRSLYLESPDWECFRQKTAGESNRLKLRVRMYMDGSVTTAPIKLEIKYRENDRISKSVAVVSLSEYQALLPAIQSWRMPDRAVRAPSDALWTFFSLKQIHALAPALNVQFQRQAFMARSDPSVRVTCDDRIIVQRARDVLEPMDAARSVLQPMQSVLEIKVEKRLPQWLQFLIRKYRLQCESVSKFCNAALATPFSLDAYV